MIKLSSILQEIQIQRPVTWKEVDELWGDVITHPTNPNYSNTQLYKDYREWVRSKNNDFIFQNGHSFLKSSSKLKLQQYYKELKALL